MGKLQFEAVRRGFDGVRFWIVALRIWIRRILSLEIHSEPHDSLFDLRHGKAALTAGSNGMIWITQAGKAFVAALFDALEAFIEVFAPLFRLENEGFLLVGGGCGVGHGG